MSADSFGGRIDPESFRLGARSVEPRAPRQPWRTTLGNAATVLSSGIFPGLLCGALIGGVGGRLAMFLLRLTSDKALHGMATDDDFTIGSFTGATFFLIVAATVLGAAGGLFYIAVRPWLPVRWRPIVAGLFAATVGGALIIHPGGVDFTMLSPLWLAVALFVLLPGAYGVALSALSDRLERSERLRRSRWRWASVLPLVLMLPALGLSGPVALAVLGAGTAWLLVVIVGHSGRLSGLWHARPVVWLGRAGLAAIFALSGVNLARDLTAIL